MTDRPQLQKSWLLQIWDTNTPNHVGHLPMRANVCCVKFSPTSAHEVAIGSADHHVHLYDLRNPAQAVHVFKGTLFLLGLLQSLLACLQPLAPMSAVMHSCHRCKLVATTCVPQCGEHAPAPYMLRAPTMQTRLCMTTCTLHAPFMHAVLHKSHCVAVLTGCTCRCAGHRKAVSYVRFMSGGRVVSASTDSTLRLWDATGSTPQRTYDGHTNEKNFVGLSVAGDFIACGSETNEVRQEALCLCMLLMLARSASLGQILHDLFDCAQTGLHHPGSYGAC